MGVIEKIQETLKDVKLSAQMGSTLPEAKSLMSIPRNNSGQVQGFVMPVSVGGGGSSGAISRGFQGVKTFIAKATYNPFAGGVAKGFVKIGGGALGALGTIKAFQLSKSAVTGQNMSVMPSIAELKDAAAFGYNPFAGAAGVVAGLGQKYGGEVKDSLVSATKKKYMSIPGETDLFFAPMQIQNAINSGMGAIQQQYADDIGFLRNKLEDLRDYSPSGFTPTINLSSEAPSLSISGGFGGGGGADMLAPLMLTLLAGGGAGYLLGRKRKKKKYKKRRKHRN